MTIIFTKTCVAFACSCPICSESVSSEIDVHGHLNLCLITSNCTMCGNVYQNQLDNLILNFFRLNLQVKVDLLKSTFRFIMPSSYFQILRQKNSKSSIWKTLKFGRETILVQIGSGSALKVPVRYTVAIWVGSYPLLSQAPTHAEVQLGCDNKLYC